MAQWNYRLTTGVALREAIDKEDYAGIVDCLKDAYQEIHGALPEFYDMEELECDLDDMEILEGTIADFRAEDGETDEEDVISEIDYNLSRFYDFCDNLRVWVNT